MRLIISTVFAALFTITTSAHAATPEDTRTYNVVHNICKFSEAEIINCLRGALEAVYMFDVKAFAPSLQAVCDGGEAQACFYTGAVLAMSNPENAWDVEGMTMKNYLKSCEAGILIGCTYFFQGYTETSEGKKQLQGQIKLQELCYGGEHHACELIGRGLTDPRWEKIYNLRSMGAAYERECNDGNMGGCSILASQAKHKPNSPETTQRQMELLEKTCNNGNVDACIERGAIYATGQENVEINTEQAIASFNQGCQIDNERHAVSCDLLGQTILNSETHLDKLSGAYSAACLGGISFDCTQFGDQAPIDEPRFTELCNDKNAAACYVLGMTSLKKNYTEPNYAQFLSKLVEACALGLPTACADLSLTLLDPPREDLVDESRAREAAERACDLGSAAACKATGGLN